MNHPVPAPPPHRTTPATPQPRSPQQVASRKGGDRQRRAVGPLGAVVTADDRHLHASHRYRLRTGANPQVLLRRIAFLTSSGQQDKDATGVLLRWAEEQQLGQDPRLLEAAAARRARAVAALTAAGTAAVRVVVEPMWRIAVGTGDRLNPHGIGLALHGTYGIPALPGSGIKGAVAAWAAQQTDIDPAQLVAVFGGPRAGAAESRHTPAAMGTVRFLDALPCDGPARIRVDVITSHAHPFLRPPTGQAPRQPPAEYHQPNPVRFLTVEHGRFGIDLLGPDQDTVEAVAGWCRSAVDDLGVGGKTAAGYGYLTTVAEDPT